MSAACWPDSAPGHAFRTAALRSTLLCSAEVVDEFHAVLHRSKFDRYIPLDQRLAFFRAFISLAEPVTITTEITACRHPPDDKFLSLAVSGNANLILTGDKDLLALHPFEGFDILNANSYLEYIAELPG
jgi:putative PIN family toxin of toxin-antitoxin system